MLSVANKKPKKTARINTGIATNDLTFSAYQETNDKVFPNIIKLYIDAGATIADVTWGKGVFWKQVDTTKFQLLKSDLKTEVPDGVTGGIDARTLPYQSSSLDAVVFDPPYMHTPGGTAHNGHQNYEGYYANNANTIITLNYDALAPTAEADETPPKYHEAVLDLYYKAAKEAFRVLKQEGIYIVKCQDEVCTNRQRLTHLEITNEFQKFGFVVEDLFVVVRKNKPGVSRIKTRQYHARKNHSYFMVYRKPTPKKQVNGKITVASRTATLQRIQQRASHTEAETRC